MNIFDPQYYLERNQLIFLEYKMNQFIDGKMIYVLGDDYKHNII